MKIPVFHVQEEVLTDAPLALVRERLQAGLPCLKACRGLEPAEAAGEVLSLRWRHHQFGAVETGRLQVGPHELGAHLRLEGSLRGWGAFLLVAWMRWRTDRLLEQIVRELA